jgi:hypothetical protein
MTTSWHAYQKWSERIYVCLFLFMKKRTKKKKRERETLEQENYMYILPSHQSFSFLFVCILLSSLLLVLSRSIMFRLQYISKRTRKSNVLSLLFNWFLFVMKKKKNHCHTVFHLFSLSIYILKSFNPEYVHHIPWLILQKITNALCFQLNNDKVITSFILNFHCSIFRPSLFI